MNFEKYFSQFSNFGVFCKGNKFPSLEGDIFVTFDYMPFEELTYIFQEFIQICRINVNFKNQESVKNQEKQLVAVFSFLETFLDSCMPCIINNSRIEKNHNLLSLRFSRFLKTVCISNSSRIQKLLQRNRCSSRFSHFDVVMWNWRGFFLIVEITSFQYFRLCACFRNFHFVKEYPLAFIADFGLRKLVLRAETRFAIIELYRKNPKVGIFVIPVGEKVLS